MRKVYNLNEKSPAQGWTIINKIITQYNYFKIYLTTIIDMVINTLIGI